MAFQPLESDPATEKRLRDFAQTLSEKDCRRFAAVEAAQRGYGGIAYVAGVLGCSTKTIERGLKELDHLQDEKKDRIGIERRRKPDLLPGSANRGRPGRRRYRVYRSVTSNSVPASR